MKLDGRRFALLGLIALAAVHLWVLFSTWEFLGFVGADLRRIVWEFAIPFVILPWALAPLPLLGAWLLLRSRYQGPGRWGWRWWTGGLLASLLVFEAIGLRRLLDPAMVNLTGGHPLVEFFLKVSALPLLWVLARPARKI